MRKLMTKKDQTFIIISRLFSVTDLMGEVSRLLVILTEISQRINGIGLEVQDESKRVT